MGTILWAGLLKKNNWQKANFTGSPSSSARWHTWVPRSVFGEEGSNEGIIKKGRSYLPSPRSIPRCPRRCGFTADELLTRDCKMWLRQLPHSALAKSQNSNKYFFKFMTLSARLNLVMMLYAIVIPPRHHFLGFFQKIFFSSNKIKLSSPDLYSHLCIKIQFFRH